MTLRTGYDSALGKLKTKQNINSDIKCTQHYTLLDFCASLENNSEYCNMKCEKRLIDAWEASTSVTLRDVMMRNGFFYIYSKTILQIIPIL